MKIAIVRVRGPINVKTEINDTLRMLHLTDKNQCVVVEATPATMGMVAKAKDFITYGPINDELHQKLLSTRGEAYAGPASSPKIDRSRHYVEHDGKKLKRFFRLHPPRGGYGRKGIKISFARGGALGDRKEKMADLLTRMM